MWKHFEPPENGIILQQKPQMSVQISYHGERARCASFDLLKILFWSCGEEYTPRDDGPSLFYIFCKKSTARTPKSAVMTVHVDGTVFTTLDAI